MNSKDIELVNQLLAKTKDGSLAWEETAFGDEFVATVGGRASFTISSTSIGSALLTMKDSFDRELVRLTEQDERLDELYEIVRRQVLRVDETVDAVLQDLRAMK